MPDTARTQRDLRLSSPAVRTAAGIASLALAAAVSWSGLLLVVRGRVIPGWEVSGALLVLALVVRRALLKAARDTETVRPARKRVTPVRLGEGLLLGAAVLGTAWGAGDDLISDARYHVLSPTGPGGCTAVVRETSFLVVGNGEAYAVGHTGLALGESGSWTVDDGYRPVAAGTYALRWGRDAGVLRVSGTNTDPVVRGGLTDVSCDW
ncbi:hypothetical protein [Streptomyces gilvus]|uniref:hypothetical protein n=1 Tax=Streptomyces gilvus TaxID=2920937 RepID=UPI001F0D4CDC|nr:hypothetical protein [Streptomyces sp. CME 23]MCH5676470.1 hypothetical protein [Streptomyces sp. CME 23]